jgi:putative DNA primase/helicase
MVAQDIVERTGDLGIDRVYIYSDSYANGLGLPRANLLNETWRTSMKRFLVTRGIKLWVIDNLASIAGGIDENTKKDWDPINAWLLELRFAGISTIMLHHTNREGTQRGTSAREDNIDNSIILKRPFDYSPEDGAKFILHFTKARVRTEDLKLIPDYEFRLTQDEAGELAWTYGNVKSQAKRAILKHIDEDMSNTDIASLVGVSRQYVSKVQIQAKQEGLLGENGKLTPSGFDVVNTPDLVDNPG